MQKLGLFSVPRKTAPESTVGPQNSPAMAAVCVSTLGSQVF